MRALLLAAGAAFVVSSACHAEPSVGLPTEAFVTTWTALSVTHFVPPPAAQTPPIRIVATKPGLDQDSLPLLEDAFASARDGRERRNLTLLETSSGWMQPQRTALEDAREAHQLYAALAPDGIASDERFVNLVRQIDDGAARSVAVEDPPNATVAEPDETTIAAARDRAVAGCRTQFDVAQAAWLRYRESLVALAAAKAPGLVPQLRRELDSERGAELSAPVR